MTLRDTWYIGAALLALARNLKAAACFCKSDLVKWCPEIEKRSKATYMALEHLQVLNFIRHIPAPGGRTPLRQGLSWYTLTPDGIEAAKAAAAEALRPLPVGDGFGARLWSLLRMRQTLTALDAATLLTDAGNDIENAKRRAAAMLRAWGEAHPAAVQTSAKRIGGFKRYVLLKDLGPNVPTVRPSARQEGTAA